MRLTSGNILAALFFPLCIATAQPESPLQPGKIGLGIDGVSSPNLLLKVFLNNRLALQVIAGFNLDSQGGDAPTGQTKVTGMNIRGGLSVVYHLTGSVVSPYIGGEGIFQRVTTGGFFVTEPDPKNIVVAGLIFGAEYFINGQFTVGIKQNVGAQILLSRDVPKEETDTMLYTSTIVTGRFYFN